VSKNGVAVELDAEAEAEAEMDVDGWPKAEEETDWEEATP
jgi:hypothetical protein